MKYGSIVKQMMVVFLVSGFVNQQSMAADDNVALVDPREAAFEAQAYALLDECIFNLEVKKSFVYYCMRLIDLAERNQDIVATRLARRSNNVSVQDFIKALKEVKRANSAVKIGWTLNKYIDALPDALRKKLKEAGATELISRLNARLKMAL